MKSEDIAEESSYIHVLESHNDSPKIKWLKTMERCQYHSSGHQKPTMKGFVGHGICLWAVAISERQQGEWRSVSPKVQELSFASQHLSLNKSPQANATHTYTEYSRTAIVHCKKTQVYVRLIHIPEESIIYSKVSGPPTFVSPKFDQGKYV